MASTRAPVFWGPSHAGVSLNSSPIVECTFEKLESRQKPSRESTHFPIHFWTHTALPDIPAIEICARKKLIVGGIGDE